MSSTALGAERAIIFISDDTRSHSYIFDKQNIVLLMLDFLVISDIIINRTLFS